MSETRRLTQADLVRAPIADLGTVGRLAYLCATVQRVEADLAAAVARGQIDRLKVEARLASAVLREALDAVDGHDGEATREPCVCSRHGGRRGNQATAAREGPARVPVEPEAG